MTSKKKELLEKLMKDLDEAVYELIYLFAEPDEVPENCPVYREIREDILNALRTGA